MPWVLGCGAFCGQRWFQVRWQEGWRERDIAFKELFPIVLAVAAWGHSWRGHQLCCKCDNQAVVCMLASRYSRSSPIMHLLRCLFFFEAYFDIIITASHSDNLLADDLSRNRLYSFFAQAPHMHRQPSPLPLMATDLLLDTDMDWSSRHWIPLFRSIVL